jgi:hypothetical protein
MRPEAPAFPAPTPTTGEAVALSPEKFAAVISNPSQGVKFDGGKLPWDLLPWDAVEEVVKVLAFGAKKYAPRNWENGIAHSRTFAATQRHLVAWFQDGQATDPDTELDPRAHAICELLFSLAFSLRAQDGQEIALPGGGTGPLDDRPRVRDTERPPAAEEPEQPFTQADVNVLRTLLADWQASEVGSAEEIAASSAIRTFVNGVPVK